MLFSFFKKAPEKMVAKPAAVPRSTKIPEPGASRADVPDSSAPDNPAPPVAPDLPVIADSSEFVFSESSPDFQVEGDIDPVDAQAEEAAMLFANGQDDAVRRALEDAVVVYRTGPAERLWLMLFDIYRLSGKKVPFEALGIEYAQAFEKSPPGWRDKGPAAAPERVVAAIRPILPFSGDLCAGNDAAFDEIQRLLAKNSRLGLDLSTVSRFDAPGCSRLLALLQQARKARHELELTGRDALAALLEARVEPGRAEDQGCWLLLLELCQLQGRYEAFEETAINYAVTFEVSPPSWEPRPALREPLAAASAVGDAAAGAYSLSGDVKASRFGDLPVHAEAHDPLLIDCSLLTRIDFISAGALLNVLTTIRRSGKQIVFHHPNHLVAELLGIVGLKAVATIVTENY